MHAGLALVKRSGAPAAQEEMRATVFNLATHNPMALFGSDQVIDQFPGRKIYVGEKRATGWRTFSSTKPTTTSCR